MSIGRQTEWSDPGTPDAPDISTAGQSKALDDATCFIRLNRNNIRIGFVSNGWTTGTVYSQYDPNINQSEYATPNYVTVDDTFVYKCIDNNNSAASTSKPSGTGSAVIELADGYVWKYVGTILNKDLYQFGSTGFAPVPQGSSTQVRGAISTFNQLQTTTTTFNESDSISSIVLGDGTGAAAAIRTSSAGGQKTVTGMFASAAGKDYTRAFAVAYKSTALGSGADTSLTLDAGEIDTITVSTGGSDYVNATVIILGDGDGAQADAVVVGGAVTTINVTDPGSGYTWARAIVIPGTVGAAAVAVLAPPTGHGSSLVTELNASTLLFSANLSSALSNYILVDSGSVDGTFRQIALIGGIRGQSGSAKNAEAYLGPSHPDYNSIVTQDKYLRGSGNVIYMNNIVAITHTSQQEEIIKISITL